MKRPTSTGFAWAARWIKSSRDVVLSGLVGPIAFPITYGNCGVVRSSESHKEYILAAPVARPGEARNIPQRKYSSLHSVSTPRLVRVDYSTEMARTGEKRNMRNSRPQHRKFFFVSRERCGQN